MAVSVQTKALRRTDAAQRLGIHPNTVGSWAERGYIKAIPYPGETRYDADSVEAFRRKIFDEE